VLAIKERSLQVDAQGLLLLHAGANGGRLREGRGLALIPRAALDAGLLLHALNLTPGLRQLRRGTLPLRPGLLKGQRRFAGAATQILQQMLQKRPSRPAPFPASAAWAASSWRASHSSWSTRAEAAN
jgi:hypothetical protein